MIRIADEILPILIKLDRDQLIIYLLINRYMTGDEDVPLDHIRKLGGLETREFFRALEKLEKHAALELKIEKVAERVAPDELASPELRGERVAPDELASKNIVIRDIINEKIAPVSFRESVAPFYIKNIESYKSTSSISKQDNKQLGVEKKNNARARGNSLSVNEQKVTRHWRTTLTKLHNKIIKNDANALVDYFAGCQLKLYDQISLTPAWRKRQFGTAQRLFRNHQLSLSTWQAAVDYFSKLEYWKDKLNSLSQVEKNIHQFLARRKKRSRSKAKVTKVS